MNDLLLIIIIAMLGYLIYILKGKNEPKSSKKEKLSYAKVLPDYQGKTCEIVVKEPMAAIDVMFSVKGILIDFDEEWLQLEVIGKKSSSIKMFRINNMASIKEIKE